MNSLTFQIVDLAGLQLGSAGAGVIQIDVNGAGWGYFVDDTPYDDTDKKDLVDGVSGLFESLKGGERFALRTITESFSSSAELLDACIPFCPDGGFLCDLFGSCTEGVMITKCSSAKRYEATRFARLMRTISTT